MNRPEPSMSIQSSILKTGQHVPHETFCYVQQNNIITLQILKERHQPFKILSREEGWETHEKLNQQVIDLCQTLPIPGI